MAETLSRLQHHFHHPEGSPTPLETPGNIMGATAGRHSWHLCSGVGGAAEYPTAQGPPTPNYPAGSVHSIEARKSCSPCAFLQFHE